MKTIKELKNRVKFVMKKKCDVCKKVKLVTHECESCYEKGFMKSVEQTEKNKTKVICEMIEKDIAFWSRHGDAIVEPLKELLKKIKGKEK